MSLRIAYMTGEYLRVSPFVFIHREIEALRRQGMHIETFSIRRPDPSELVSEDQRREESQTYFVLGAPIIRSMIDHFRLFISSPGRFVSVKMLAWRTRAPGLKGWMRMAAYFYEAGIVAARMRERGLTHLHNHLADSSCTVALLASKLGGFSYSFSIHGPGIFYEPQHWRIGEKAAEALFTRTISHFCRSQLMAFTAPEHWPRLHIVHCGIDPARFTPRNHDGTGTNLLYIGRLSAVKGLPVLIEALGQIRQRHPGVRLRLAGDGPDRTMLQTMVAERDLTEHVDFLGYQNQEQLADVLADTDVFVMSSFAEGVPVVLMEAMAAGVPVVATHIAGNPELIEDGISGYLTAPGDVTMLASRVDALLADGALRQRLADAGRRKVEEEFDIDREAAWLKTIMENALEGKTTGLRPDSEKPRW